MGFQAITNSITTKLNAVATTNTYEVRYDNDPRTTPKDKDWLLASVKLGERNQVQLGTVMYRTTGLLSIQVKTEHAKGSAPALIIADVLSAAFDGTTLDDFVKFETSRIENVGRVGDNYQVNVICPFHADE